MSEGVIVADLVSALRSIGVESWIDQLGLENFDQDATITAHQLPGALVLLAESEERA